MAVIDFYRAHPLDGYRRCSYMMIDQNVAFLPPSTVYHILKSFNVIRSRNTKISKKGNGFDHAKAPHEQWHSDISNVHIENKFYYLISILDGYSRFVVHWELREKMEDRDVCIVQERALEKFPTVTPRMISDNGKQYLSKDYQALLKLHGLKHTRTSPYYPQSNGKQERFHKTIKGAEGLGYKHYTDKEYAKQLLENSITNYNFNRLHSAIGYITPFDMMNFKQAQIHQERDCKLEKARLLRYEINNKFPLEILPAGEAFRRKTTEAQVVSRINRNAVLCRETT